ncbi:L-serine dehydratase 1 [Micromonospora sp. MW-13]|uniref:L-serine ammonia-lyase n=1 Tax=unclassified Micromonospora TaxID=2617518 RepID=UPI000E437BB3|nr:MULTISPECIES: L-serine ammonia-lyase [unclassified Micromonospora]MCX4472689.1 L-serine ammonia-lyase [Micromonospora sp. NBC_01655]RGC69386.1 L-serine dehydratase 1 [Micromonospora sp. MW-13]
MTDHPPAAVVSVFDLFRVGIGPSSSHTVGPMRAARTFAVELRDLGLLARVAQVRVELFGSLGSTGIGHGTDLAVILGLEGESPDEVDPDAVPTRIATVRTTGVLRLLGTHPIAFREAEHVRLHRRESLPMHPNGMRLRAFDRHGGELCGRDYYSVGGGSVADHTGRIRQQEAADARYPYRTATELLAHCAETGLPISEISLANELALRTEQEVRDGLLRVWTAMQDCVVRGLTRDGALPGPLRVPRRARHLHERLLREEDPADPLRAMEWVNLFALAVNEENAAGGRVVTAPTNGAAGIVPAVLSYYLRFVPGGDDAGVVRFLLVAGAIGAIYKQTASISGAEVGCQGEVGTACSMAAAGLTEVLGGTPQQVECAAEVAMEHNLGLTCDPVGGLVQIPCIERNAIGAVKAINAARMALRRESRPLVSLDVVIKTMRDTGADMKTKYKETAQGGLAVNVIEC